MRYHEAIEFLHGLTLFGSQFGLEHPRQLAARAGNPQDRLRFIHVAGTNGKGSTCAMLESIYRASGLRVGLYTSPHLVHFSERIQVNRQPIPEAELARLVEQLRRASAAAEPGHPAGGLGTFFEFVTVLALMYFAEQKCDLVIWETGLGGRLDATNIVTPLASVITNIQFDHERWLGDTLEKIAGEKAGIIKPGVPVVTSVAAPAALAVIQATAQRQASALTLVPQGEAGSAQLDRFQLPLLGRHQQLNAALAAATVRVLGDTLPVGAAAVCEGLAQVRWPGRMQLVERTGGRRLLLDGAHNPAGALTLREALGEHFPGVKPALILGALADKDCRSIGETLAPLASRILCVPVKSERTAAAEQMAGICRQVNAAVPTGTEAGLAEALQALAEERFVVLAGSLYLIGEAMELLQLSAPTSADEKRLNEWGASASARP